MNRFCDLHCHYLPAIDDGVTTLKEGIELCQGLHKLGYETVVATPHIRSGMFNNRKPNLVQAYEAFVAAASGEAGMPITGLAAEHFCDDIFSELFDRGESLPYPGGHAALIEFPPERLPLRVEDLFFRMRVRGVRPVIAHPERYTPVFRSSEPIANLVDRGALALLDVMSLVGKYGRKAEQAAERMLDDGLYFAACSDTHKPADLPVLARAIARLKALVGEEEAAELLGDHPRQILDGSVPD